MFFINLGSDLTIKYLGYALAFLVLTKNTNIETMCYLNIKRFDYVMFGLVEVESTWFLYPNMRIMGQRGEDSRAVTP